MENSSQAYDNKLLAKIGKPKTPPRGSASSSFDASSPTSSLSFYPNGRQPQLKSLSISEGMRGAPLESPFKPGSPFSSHGGSSPHSRGISPSLLSSAASAKSYMDFRSPTWDSSVPSSAGGDRQGPPHQQRHYSSPSIPRQGRGRRSGSGSVFSNHESAASSINLNLNYIKSESDRERESAQASGGIKRAIEDQSFKSEDSADFPMEDTGASSNTTALRQLHLEDQTPPASFDQYYTDSKSSGMKRGASSPPPDASRGDKVPTHSVGGSTDPYQRNTSSHLQANNRDSPITRYAQPHGSVSSPSSQGLHNGSYASSAALSAGNSSITSISSHERLSPRGVSPSSEHHMNIKNEGPYYNQPPMNPSPQDTFPHTHQRTPSDPQAAAAIARKMSSDPPPQRKSSAPSLQAHVHICTCCPKKPKKFDTLEELRYVSDAFARLPRLILIPAGFINPKSNTHVDGVTTNSRIRTKPSGIRILFTSASTLGPAQLWPTTTSELFTLPQPSSPTTRTASSLPRTPLPIQRFVGIVELNSRTSHNQTGMHAAVILPRFISSGNATSLRNSSVPTISASI